MIYSNDSKDARKGRRYNALPKFHAVMRTSKRYQSPRFKNLINLIFGDVSLY